MNNFGYSGSNGHAVLKALPAENELEFLDAENFEGHIKTKRLFVLSANDEAAARQSMEKLGIFLEQHAELYQSTMPRNLSCEFRLLEIDKSMLTHSQTRYASGVHNYLGV